MHQLLMNSKGAVVTRAPKPSLGAQQILVKVNYSMVSTGTEIAPLKYTLAEPGAIVSPRAMSYVGKAVRNPRKAAAKLKQIAGQKVRQVSASFPRGSREAADVTHSDSELQSRSELTDTGWGVGYSCMGEVVAVGSAIKDINVGDSVACGGAGIANHAEFVAVPRHLACVVPAGCDSASAAITTIGSIALQGVRRADQQLGSKVAVLGLGLLGQLTVQLLQANGCDVYGFDPSAERVERAKALGMAFGSHDETQFALMVRDATAGFGVDCTLIAAATKSDTVVNHAMQYTRRKGKVVIVGDVGLHVARADFYKKEIDLLISTSYGPGRYDANYEQQGQDYPYAYVRWTLNRNMQTFLNLVAKQKVQVKPLIDKVINLHDTPDAYLALAQSDNPPLGVLIEYSDTPDEQTQLTIAGHRKPRQGPAHYALVGAGAFGTCMLVPHLNKHSDKVFLRAVVCQDAVRGGNYVRDNAIEILTSHLQDVLSNEDISLLVISTRHHLHAEQVIAGLSHGKHVFVEKPLATDWQSLEAISEVYQGLDDKPLLMVGFNRRFSPAMQALKAALRDRRKPLMLNYRMNAGYIPLDHWIQTEQGAGRNIGEACHIYDCFRYLTGAAVVNVQASSISSSQSAYASNDNFVATISYEDGSVANLIYTAMGPKQGMGKEHLNVFSDGEAYQLNDYKSLIRVSDNSILWQGEMDKGHANELAAVAAAVSENKQAVIAIDEIMETTAVALLVEDALQGRE